MGPFICWKKIKRDTWFILQKAQSTEGLSIRGRHASVLRSKVRVVPPNVTFRKSCYVRTARCRVIYKWGAFCIRRVGCDHQLMPLLAIGFEGLHISLSACENNV